MRRHFWLIARVVVSAGLLYWFFHKVNLGALWRVLSSASPGWLALANVLTIPVIVLVSWKWQILLRALNIRHSLWQLIRMNLVSGFYGLILPGEETGQLAKGVILAREAGAGDAVAASIVMDEILGTLSIFSIALVALGLTHNFGLRVPLAAALAVLWGLFSAVLAFTLCPPLYDRGRAAAGWLLHAVRLSVLDAWLDPFWRRIRSYQHQAGPLGAAFAITVAAHLLAEVSVIATMRSVGVNLSFIDVCWIVAAISALVTIPLTVSGIGIREGANVIVLGQLGVAASQALAVSSLAFAIGIIWGLPGGLLQFLSFRRRAAARAEIARELVAEA